ncbi:MAG: 3-deoxy-manno-octulosonate cytidylyltransferase [Planctomycetes bacterium]|nr:3-deoxy-manno-octulosonate cytidylyltransferase [Planctomycetota bacterium]
MKSDGPSVRGDAAHLRALAVVPARLGSSRLARKMLLRDSGRYLFEHTVLGVRRARALARVVLATDSTEILAAAHEVGIEALLTSSAHASGTDRVHEAFELLLARGEGPFDVVLNVQGDEPEVLGETLDPLIGAFAAPEVELATLCTPLPDERDAQDPSIVKVVLDSNGDALYFSRAPIPGLAPTLRAHAPAPFQRHVGVYAFRPAALRRFCSLPRGVLEARESLEQLRWLEAGLRIRVLATATGSVGIDTPEHYAQFLVRERSRNPSTAIPGARARSKA